MFILNNKGFLSLFWTEFSSICLFQVNYASSNSINKVEVVTPFLQLQDMSTEIVSGCIILPQEGNDN